MFLTILNTIAIIIIFFKLELIKITIRRDETFWNKTLMGYDIWINKIHIRIPILNKRKTELKEEVDRMKLYSDQNKIQALSAIFSWCKTYKQVRQFEKDYRSVDGTIVELLIANFIPRQ